jgi:hypothetical protein
MISKETLEYIERYISGCECAWLGGKRYHDCMCMVHGEPSQKNDSSAAEALQKPKQEALRKKEKKR